MVEQVEHDKDEEGNAVEGCILEIGVLEGLPFLVLLVVRRFLEEFLYILLLELLELPKV